MKYSLIPRVVLGGLISVSVQAECDRPWPVDVPDGKTADKEEMLQAQRAIKAYMAEADAYLMCLEEEEAAVQVDPNDEEALQEAMEAQAIRTRRHNAMVDEMHLIAERYNQTVRAYKNR